MSNSILSTSGFSGIKLTPVFENEKLVIDKQSVMFGVVTSHTQQIIDFHENAVGLALIKLGWTPPKDWKFKDTQS